MKPGDKVKLGGMSVLIGTPSFDAKVAAAYTRSMVDTMVVLDRYGIGVGLDMFEKSTLLPYVRNRIVQDFLTNYTTATHLLFIDADMGWPAEAIPELLARKKDVIAAVGITKDEDPEQRRFCVEIDKTIKEEDGLLRVRSVGTGFMLIARHVLEKMWARYNKDPYPVPPEEPTAGRVHRVFDYDFTVPKEGWGEDYTFCRRWREMGGEIWVDPSIRLLHVGSYNYTGTYMDWLMARRQPQAAE